MSDQNELQQDLEELNRLRQLATRPYVKDFLSNEALKLQAAIGRQTLAAGGEPMVVETCSVDNGQVGSVASVTSEAPATASAAAAAAAAAAPLAVSKSAPPRYYKDITTYGWDQSDNFMKIYITVTGVQKLSKDSITCEYTSKSFKLKVENLNGLNYCCHVAGLWGKVVPDQSYHKVKSDCVLVMLKKEEEKKTWAFVTEREDKKKKPMPSMDEKKDPSDGLMDLLKQMYEDGDDDMKRTIAKSWTESRNKPGGGGGLDV